jgi:hypothetical protein
MAQKGREIGSARVIADLILVAVASIIYAAQVLAHMNGAARAVFYVIWLIRLG